MAKTWAYGPEIWLKYGLLGLKSKLKLLGLKLKLGTGLWTGLWAESKLVRLKISWSNTALDGNQTGPALQILYWAH